MKTQDDELKEKRDGSTPEDIPWTSALNVHKYVTSNPY
jgi:hypothetical protein